MHNRSTTRQFVHYHPFYSILGAALGTSAPFVYGWKFIPLALASLNLAREVWNEFKHIKDPIHQVESIFEDAEVKEGDLVIGRLRHYEDKMPLVEIYTSEPDLNGRAFGSLLSKRFRDLDTEYFSYLFTIARLLHGPRGKSAIQFINEEIRRRNINFDLDTIRLHYILKKVNQDIANYNKTAPFFLQQANPFSMDYLRAMMAFCEVEKGVGANGCSTSVISAEDGIKYFIRNLDWFTLGSFYRFLIAILQPTQHVNKSDSQHRPQATLSFTVVPGAIQAITGFNDSLGIAYNEVGGKTGNRENPKKAYPGLSLVQLIVENCKTMEEVEAFLQAHQPASQNNLIITTSTQDGVIQSLPTDSADIFRIRGQDDVYSVATNHFLDEKNQPLLKTACVPCSKKRFDKMHDAIINIKDIKKNMSKIAASSATSDTVQTILTEYDHPNKQAILRVKMANGFAPTAPDAKGNTGYTTIVLNDLFKNFAEKVQTFDRAYASSEQKTPSHEQIIDTSLINLMNKSNEVSNLYPALACELSALYSALNEQVARQAFSSASELSNDDIQKLAEGTIDAVNAIIKNKYNNSAIQQYERLLSQHLPKSRLIYDKTKLLDALMMVFLSVSLDLAIKYCLEKNSPVLFYSFACSYFSNGILRNIARVGDGLLAGVSLAAFSMFRRPEVVTSAQNVLKSLNELRLH